MTNDIINYIVSNLNHETTTGFKKKKKTMNIDVNIFKLQSTLFILPV